MKVSLKRHFNISIVIVVESNAIHVTERNETVITSRLQNGAGARENISLP